MKGHGMPAMVVNRREAGVDDVPAGTRMCFHPACEPSAAGWVFDAYAGTGGFVRG